MPVPKLRFKDEQGQEYPEWEKKKLGVIADFFNGDRSDKYPKPQEIQRWGIPFINAGNLNSGKVAPVDYITKQKYDSMGGAKLSVDDILFCLRGTVGKNAIYDKAYGSLASSLVAIRVKTGILAIYLYEYINSDKVIHSITKLITGGAQPNLSCLDLKKLKISIPSLPEQEKIADFLSSYDRMIDVQAKRVEAMKLRKKGLLQKIFSQELRFKDERGQEYPEWSRCKIEDLCYMKGRIGWQGLKAKDFIEEGPYCVTGTDFIDGKVNWKTCYHVSQLRYEMDSNIQLRDGDLLITKDGTIGKLAYIEKLPGEACLNSHLLVIRPSVNKLTNKFLYQVFSSNLFVEYYLRAGSGSTMKSLSQSVIGKFMCPLPSIPEQEKIADFLSAVDTQIEVEEKRLETMKTIKKGLLQQMFI